VLALHRDLLCLRRSCPALSNGTRELTQASFDDYARWFTMLRSDPIAQRVLVLCNFSNAPQSIPVAKASAGWNRLLWSEDPRYAGPAHAAAPPKQIESSTSAVDLGAWSCALYSSDP
jgi:hypothetical protein